MAITISAGQGPPHYPAGTGGDFRVGDAVSFFSDLLSYSRLMALGLSGLLLVRWSTIYFVQSPLDQLGFLAGLAIFAGTPLNLVVGIKYLCP